MFPLDATPPAALQSGSPGVGCAGELTAAVGNPANNRQRGTGLHPEAAPLAGAGSAARGVRVPAIPRREPAGGFGAGLALQSGTGRREVCRVPQLRCLLQARCRLRKFVASGRVTLVKDLQNRGFVTLTHRLGEHVRRAGTGAGRTGAAGTGAVRWGRTSGGGTPDRPSDRGCGLPARGGSEAGRFPAGRRSPLSLSRYDARMERRLHTKLVAGAFPPVNEERGR